MTTMLNEGVDVAVDGVEILSLAVEGVEAEDLAGAAWAGVVQAGGLQYLDNIDIIDIIDTVAITRRIDHFFIV